MKRTNNKKMFAIILLFVFLANLIPTGMAVAEAIPVSLFINPESITANSCVESSLKIRVENVVNLTAYHIKVNFDADLVEVLDVMDGGFLSSPDPVFYEPKKIDNVNGWFSYGVIKEGTDGDPSPKSGSGDLFVIKFKAKQPVNPGQVAIFEIDAAESMLVDWPDAFEIPFTVTGGTTVTTATCELMFTVPAFEDVFLAGLSTEFDVSLMNPVGGNEYDSVRFRFMVENINLSDIERFDYLDTAADPDEWKPMPLQQEGDNVVGFFGPESGFPLSAPYNEFTEFRLNLKVGGTFPVSIGLYDLSSKPDTLLTMFEDEIVAYKSTITGTLEHLVATFPAEIPQVVVDANYKIDSRFILGEPLPTGTKVSVKRDGTSILDEYEFNGTEVEFWLTELISGATRSDFDAHYGGKVETYEITLSSNSTPIDTTVTIQSVISSDGFLDEEVVLAQIMLDVEVVESNIAPSAEGDEYFTDKNTVLEVSAPGVLANDIDDDGDTLTAWVVAGPDHGTLTLNPDGSFTYNPDPDFVGTDTFTYRANDGTVDSNPATVTIEVNEVFFIYIPLINFYK